MNPDKFDLPATWSRRNLLKGGGLLLAVVGGAPALAACGNVKGDDTAGGDDGELAIRTVQDIVSLDRRTWRPRRTTPS